MWFLEVQTLEEKDEGLMVKSGRFNGNVKVDIMQEVGARE